MLQFVWMQFVGECDVFVVVDDVGVCVVVFVGDFFDEFFYEVFESYEFGGFVVFVDYDGELVVLSFEFCDEVVDVGGFGNLEWFCGQGVDGNFVVVFVGY